MEAAILRYLSTDWIGDSTVGANIALWQALPQRRGPAAAIQPLSARTHQIAAAGAGAAGAASGGPTSIQRS